MTYYLRKRVLYSEIPIGKGQRELYVKFELEREVYGISGFASWDTTIQIVEKTKGSFTLRFAKECPQENGKLYLNIHSP
jgi:hypothetical protein